jgi:hypothetical protein
MRDGYQAAVTLLGAPLELMVGRLLIRIERVTLFGTAQAREESDDLDFRHRELRRPKRFRFWIGNKILAYQGKRLIPRLGR